MKIIIIVFTLVLSFNTHAGLGWFLLGAAAGSGSKKVSIPVKSELQTQIDQIQKMLPKNCHNSSKYDFCWANFSKATQKYSVSREKGTEISNYFINNGYKAKLESEILSFDFSTEHQTYLAHQKVFLSTQSMILFSILGFFVGLIAIFNYSHHRYVKKIKKLYQLNTKNLHFHNKDDKLKFEQELYKNGIPSGWAFVLENNEIKSITNHSNHGYRKVASQKDQMIKNIRAVFNY